MAKKDILNKAVAIAETVSALSPQIALLAQVVKAGYMGVQAVRGFYATQGHDNETLDAIIADMDRRIKRWEDADFTPR